LDDDDVNVYDEEDDDDSNDDDDENDDENDDGDNDDDNKIKVICYWIDVKESCIKSLYQPTPIMIYRIK